MVLHRGVGVQMDSFEDATTPHDAVVATAGHPDNEELEHNDPVCTCVERPVVPEGVQRLPSMHTLIFTGGKRQCSGSPAVDLEIVLIFIFRALLCVQRRNQHCKFWYKRTLKCFSSGVLPSPTTSRLGARATDRLGSCSRRNVTCAC